MSPCPSPCRHPLLTASRYRCAMQAGRSDGPTSSTWLKARTQPSHSFNLPEERCCVV